MEFPRLVHRGEERLRVNTERELELALAEGWGLHRAAPVESEAEPPKRGPGRPRKDASVS